jgi:hypothetical protein
MLWGLRKHEERTYLFRKFLTVKMDVAIYKKVSTALNDD